VLAVSGRTQGSGDAEIQGPKDEDEDWVDATAMKCTRDVNGLECFGSSVCVPFSFCVSLLLGEKLCTGKIIVKMKV